MSGWRMVVVSPPLKHDEHAVPIITNDFRLATFNFLRNQFVRWIRSENKYFTTCSIVHTSEKMLLFNCIPKRNVIPIIIWYVNHYHSGRCIEICHASLERTRYEWNYMTYGDRTKMKSEIVFFVFWRCQPVRVLQNEYFFPLSRTSE